MKRSYCFFLLPILVASAGCPSTDNNVGSLGQDAGAAGSSGKDAGGAAAQPADGGVADSGACGVVWFRRVVPISSSSRWSASAPKVAVR